MKRGYNGVAVYVRVSTKDQSESEQIPALIKGFNLPSDVAVYREEVSAWSIDKAHKRLELIRLLKDIKAGVLDELYIWDIDRLYRNRKKMREFMNLCVFHGVSVYSLNQKWLNDFNSLKAKMPEHFRFYIEHIYNLLLDVYSQTAEDESVKKSERVHLKIVRGADGVTRSTNGKKWGRRSLPDRVIKEVLDYSRGGSSIRWIAHNVHYYNKHGNKTFLGVGTVHKIISENRGDIDTL